MTRHRNIIYDQTYVLILETKSAPELDARQDHNTEDHKERAFSKKGAPKLVKIKIVKKMVNTFV